jgi:glycosyltransferase involved in cell wall biosynthesis
LPVLRRDVVARGLERRILFHEAVPPETVLHYSADATIGVHPIEDTCLNHRYCLPNKLFEYLQAGLPVVVSDLPEMASVVRRYQVGRTFRSGDPASLAETLNCLLGDLTSLDRYREAVRVAAEDLRWEREQTKLLEVYGRLVGAA